MKRILLIGLCLLAAGTIRLAHPTPVLAATCGDFTFHSPGLDYGWEGFPSVAFSQPGGQDKASCTIDWQAWLTPQYSTGTDQTWTDALCNYGAGGQNISCATPVPAPGTIGGGGCPPGVGGLYCAGVIIGWAEWDFPITQGSADCQFDWRDQVKFQGPQGGSITTKYTPVRTATC